MNNSLSASKKVKGIQSDSCLEKKINKQTTQTTEMKRPNEFVKFL